MKVLLKDGTAIDHVLRVDEKINVKENGGNPAVIIHISYDSGITGDEIAQYNQQAGFEQITVATDDGKELFRYENAGKLASIHVAYIESGKSLVLTFAPAEE